MITQSELKEVLFYDETTGQFTWIKPSSRSVKVGDVAGHINKSGYVRLCVNDHRYLAHRLAWLYVHGSFPATQLDHINGVKSDNRIQNLRLATAKQNAENRKLMVTNTTGHRGVYWVEKVKKWKVEVMHNSITHYLGMFDSLNQAVEVAKRGRDVLFTHHKTSYSS